MPENVLPENVLPENLLAHSTASGLASTRPGRRRRLVGITLGCVAASVLTLATADPSSAAPVQKRDVPAEASSAGSSAHVGSDGAQRALARHLATSVSQVKTRQANEAKAAETGSALEKKLGRDATAGSYLDARGTLITTVTSSRAASTAKQAGVTTRTVRFSGRQLDTVKTGLDRFAASSGAGRVQSWGVDAESNTVTVRTAAGAADAATKAFVAKAAASGAKVRVLQVGGKTVTMANLYGGQQIEFGYYVCSVGFNTRNSAGNPVMLTAGHCGEGYQTFSRSGVTIGKTSKFTFPGSADFAEAPISSSWTPVGAVDAYDGSSAVAVKGSTPAAVGAAVCKSGRTTGWTCGAVTAVNQTVNYGNEDGSTSTVTGLTQTSACTEGGDSGGSNMSGGQAQGMTSGGQGYDDDGNPATPAVCGEKVDEPNVSFIQPVNEALSTYGLTLITG